MTNSTHFVWCDLSTFNLGQARAFYGGVFGWESAAPDGAGVGQDYTLLRAPSGDAAAVYTMPEFFQSIRMPSFWMSYVRVEGLDGLVARAVELGAKCEIEPTWFDETSRFALIRDPAGAGFTLYEGPDLSGRDPRPGRMAWNELHVPSLTQIEPFYRGLFGWETAPDTDYPNRRWLLSPEGEALASLAEFTEAEKGPKNYWAVQFAAEDIEATLEAIVAHGGMILSHPAEDLGYAMALDDQGAMFCVTRSS